MLGDECFNKGLVWPDELRQKGSLIGDLKSISTGYILNCSRSVYSLSPHFSPIRLACLCPEGPFKTFSVTFYYSETFTATSFFKYQCIGRRWNEIDRLSESAGRSWIRSSFATSIPISRRAISNKGCYISLEKTQGEPFATTFQEKMGIVIGSSKNFQKVHYQTLHRTITHSITQVISFL